MIQKLEGLKTTLWSGLAVAISVISILYTQPFWQIKITLIEQVLFGLFVVGIILSAQFSRSRFTIITGITFFFYLVYEGIVAGKPWITNNTQWLYLTVLFSLAYLTVVKDRAIFSIHGVIRLIALCFCIALAKLWLYFSAWLTTYLAAQKIDIIDPSLLYTQLPLLIVGLFILYKSVRHPSLLISSLLTSLILVNLCFGEQIELPISVLFTFLTMHFLIVIIIDSYYLAYRDELTNLPSRRALNQYALSLGRKYCVAMLDIDHFKKFNDNYGHDIGDQVLKLVAAKLAEVKAGGRVFRYGGEEFTAIFPRKDADAAYDELEKLRKSIADYDIVIRHPVRKTKKARQDKNQDNKKTVSVTISIGVATRESKATFEQTVKSADEALYRAKKKGRNQVCY